LTGAWTKRKLPGKNKRMKFSKPKFIALGFLLVLLAGCQSGKLTHYIAPQITGRVLSADTHQPLTGVNVVRTGSRWVDNSSGPVKGGQLLTQPRGVRTDAGGYFVLDGQSVFALFRQSGSWSVSVAFRFSGYASFQTNFIGTNVTSYSAGETPIINVGDVLLHPLGR